MKILFDSIFIFIFINILFYCKLPNINNDNLLIHKCILFILTSIFYYILSLIRKTGNKKCIINHHSMINNSIKIGLSCVVGYSLYFDFLLMSWSKDLFVFGDDNIYKTHIMISIIIVILITIIQIFESIFYNSESFECTNKN